MTKNKKYDKTVIILAGGKGSRMGYVDKAFLEFDGKSFISHILEKVKNFNEIIIVSNNIAEYDGYIGGNIRVVEDIVKEIGPIGGIYTGLVSSTSEKNLVISCDTPFLHDGLIDYLGSYSNSFFAVVPKYIENGINRREPLCSLYSKSLLENIRKNIKNKKYRIGSIFDNLDINWIDLDKFGNSKKIIAGFRNINTPKNLSDIGGTICA